MKIRFLKEASLDKLKKDIDKNIRNYRKSDERWVKDEDLIEFKKEFLDFELDTSAENPEKTDFENIKIIYSNMQNLTDSQACDERLWAGLCHDKFWGYMQYRWQFKKARGDDKAFIEKNYFFAHSAARSLMTNALARLWWVGKLTYDAGAKDPFVLTKYLCKDLNGRGFPLLAGSNFSSNKEITKTFLYTLMNFEDNEKLSRAEFLEMVKIMNLWGGKIVLDSLRSEDLTCKIELYLKRNLAKIRRSSKK